MTKKAMILMFEKHKDQVDKTGVPYVFHPFHVAETLDDEISVTAALLHDIVEDTDMTFDQLSLEFPSAVIEPLKLLTHERNVDYFDYIKKIGPNETARKVKLADLKHNSDLSRIDHPSDYDYKRTEKYLKCIDYLESLEEK
ncbi:MAG: HD domain-containing protein, partial [Erysipelotrichaceae bacterium]|nr:HD domain-containing protein [Erysipelotrichaceae bacterium]